MMLEQNNTSLVNLFDSEDFGRTTVLMIEGEPWFIGKEIADKLGYSDTDQAIRNHIDDEDKRLITKEEIKSRNLNGFKSPRGLIIINESGLYSLILSSRLPIAKKFKRYVTLEILPNLRKTGFYSIKKLDSYMIDNPIQRAKRWIEEQEEFNQQIKQKEEQIKELEPKAEKYENVIQKNQGLFSMNQIVKLVDICKIDFETGRILDKVGRTKLFRLLRCEFFTNENVPRQKYMNRNYFEVKLTKIRTGEEVLKTFITPKGLDYILSFLYKNGYSSRQKIDWKNKEQVQEIYKLMEEERLEIDDLVKLE